LQCKWGNVLWKGEYDVEVLDGEKIRGTRLHPLGSGCRLAFRTVAVTTGVVGDLAMATTIAFSNVTSKSCRATDHDVAKGSPLLG
jgi:hypothetical protein